MPMNSPGTPGQNSIGRNAQSVVAVELTTGQNIRLAASVKAAMGPAPSSMRRSAYSTTTIAPSTSIPTAKIRPNMTMLEIDTPMIPKRTKHSRNEVGIANPTRSAERVPRNARTTIITSAIAVRTEPSSCCTMDLMVLDWSREVPRVTAFFISSGHVWRAASTSSRTRATVSMMLNPLRLTTCRATVDSPLKRAVPVRSSNVRRISARSPMVTTRSPLVLTGRS